jgi:hypothetical protein
MPSAGPQPRQKGFSVRYQARVDKETSAKLEELATTVHRTRGAMLCAVLHWGLAQSYEWTIDRATPTTPDPVMILIDHVLLQRVQAAGRHRRPVWRRGNVIPCAR